MQLVITEKPSVAISFARILGATKRCDGYLEGNGYLVSWCVGHLVELAGPASYDDRYNKWRPEDLPIIPEEWKYQILPSTRKQFEILKSLIRRKNQGYGTELVRFVHEHSKTLGCRKMFLLTHKHNASACRCYKKAGGICNAASDDIVFVFK